MLRYLTFTVVLSVSSLTSASLQERRVSSVDSQKLSRQDFSLGTKIKRSSRIIDFSLGTKIKRSSRIIGNVVFTGLNAVKDLLANTKMIATHGKHRQYVKKGGLKEAVNDFFSVDPAGAQVFARQGEYRGITARVGDRDLVLKYDEVEKHTTLDIFKRHPKNGVFKFSRDKDTIPSERIIYLDNLDID